MAAPTQVGVMAHAAVAALVFCLFLVRRGRAQQYNENLPLWSQREQELMLARGCGTRR